MEDLRKKMKVMEKELDAAKKVNDDLVQDVRRERDLHMAAEAALANLKKAVENLEHAQAKEEERKANKGKYIFSECDVALARERLNLLYNVHC